MDSYIIRIYRRDVERDRQLAGLVERIGDGKRQAFGNSDELWAFLTGLQPSEEVKVRSEQRSKAQR